MTASQAGDANYNAAGTVVQSFTIAAPTPTGSNVAVSLTVGSNTIHTDFKTVMTAGTTSITPIDPATAGSIPGGFAISDTNLAFSLITTASYSDQITTCFLLNSITEPAQFQNPYPLRILHREMVNDSYTLVDGTILTGRNSPNPTTKTICAKTPSLSLFVFAKAIDFTPLKISDFTLSQNPARVGTTVVLAAKASDVDTGNSNIALMEYSVDDGKTWRVIGSNYTSPTVTVSVPLNLQTGAYSVCVRAADAAQNSSYSCVPILAIYDPNGPFVTGNGWIRSDSGKVEFEFNAKYHKDSTVPSGDTNVDLQAADMHFRSTSYEWLVVSGSRAQIKGSGKINGKGDYGILLTAIDGKISDEDRMDRVRLKIWNKADGVIIYDNVPAASDIESTGTKLGGGYITIDRSR